MFNIFEPRFAVKCLFPTKKPAKYFLPIAYSFDKNVHMLQDKYESRRKHNIASKYNYFIEPCYMLQTNTGKSRRKHNIASKYKIGNAIYG